MNERFMVRVFNIDKKEMYYPAHLDYGDIYFDAEGLMYHFHDGKMNMVAVGQYIKMQCTGVRYKNDDNGDFLWEGDVISYASPFTDNPGFINGEIEWFCGGFVVKYKDPTRVRRFALWDLQNQYVEVLGNIYEHPELLEKLK